MAQETRAAIGSITPGFWHSAVLSGLLAGVYLSNLLPDPLDLIATAVVYTALITFIIVQSRSSSVRHRVAPRMGWGMLVCAAVGLVSYCTAAYLEDHAGMPWIWAPAALLVGGSILVIDRRCRKKGIPAP
ncbi:hypothetical protein [Streptomyces sp. ISL-11]|uniref:hypothetical protein n=1 Tax=Streptomyces sp. ISL-11 TaxID=2819174 RepID=UPI001BE9E84F|nr:hypothetical protein [Streptomyces sp. ISL-11]MBT2383079.1 hypothetical protein [Streptomyces sp. ISL-11]